MYIDARDHAQDLGPLGKRKNSEGGYDLYQLCNGKKVASTVTEAVADMIIDFVGPRVRDPASTGQVHPRSVYVHPHP